jgi:putative ABC transport system permease protein
MIDWRHIVIEHARRTGAEALPAHAIDEIAAHLDDLYAAAVAAGASPDRARASAMAALDEAPLRGLGGPARRRRPPAAPAGLGPVHRTSPFGGRSMIDAVRLACRQFVRHPGFAAITVLVLGLAIGAGVAVYTVVDAVLLRPLPYREPDRLVGIWDTNHERGLRHERISPVNFMDYRALEVFEDAAAWWRPDVNLTDPGVDPVRVNAVETGANLFRVLGAGPQLGPGFPADGPMFSPDLIAVISDRLWRSRYQADPGIIGRSIRLNGVSYAVVGVMPPRFDFPGDIDVWQRSRWDFHNHSRGAHFMEAVARLAPGVSLASADAAAAGLAQRLEQDFARTNRAWGVRLISLMEDQLGYYRPALFVLFGAVGLLMLIGCLNVASLLLTRALSREREVAVRTALGASPRHLLAQLLAESSVLAAAGAIVGTLAAVAALPLLIALTPVEIPRLDEAALNWRVLVFAVGAAVAMTLIFGIVPAIALMRRNVTTDLKSGERGSSRTTRVVYRALVAGEVAVACALLIASGLLVRTVSRMMEVPVGVGTTGVMTASVQLAPPGSSAPTDFATAVASWQTTAATYDALLGHVRSQPGVRAAGAANFLPLDPGWRVPFTIEGQPPVAVEEQPQAQIHSVSEGFFEAIGAPIVAGRSIAGTDRTGHAGVVVVNQTFARRFLGDGNPIGKIYRTTTRGIGPLGFNLLTPPPTAPVPGGTAPPPVLMRFEIVGVVSDVRNVPLAQPIEPAVYFSAHQFPFRAMFLAVDAAEPAAGIAAMQSALRSAAPAVPLADARTWEARMSGRTGEPRLLMTVLVFFGVLAGGLAVLGVYGLFSWMVALRQRELAIRLTLGARPGGIGWLVTRQAFVLVGIGLAIGWLLVRAADASLARVLFEVAPGDPSTAVAVVAMLLGASMLACVAPALRAMRVVLTDSLRD